MLYMVTFTINIPPMLAYIPYMDPMGIGILPPRDPPHTWVGLIGPLQLRKFTGGLAGGEVDGLEDLLVQLPRLILTGKTNDWLVVEPTYPRPLTIVTLWLLKIAIYSGFTH